MGFRSRSICALLAGVSWCASVAWTVPAHAAELIFLSNQGANPGVQALAQGFMQASGHKVTVLDLPASELAQRIADGPADLMSLNPEALAGLAQKGRVVADSVTPFTIAGLGVSVRAGAPKPDISTVDAYKAALLNAKSIGYSRGCSGQHVAEGIAQLGLTDQLKPKVQLTGGGTGPVTFFLARGDFELGIQQTNVMVGSPGTDYVGPVPGALNKPCPNSVGLLSVSKQPDVARAMIKFMISPEAAPLLRKVHEEQPKS
ncbi:MAG TPA: substrate-binding domain-containing protein [Xanthobacteraceae bacterium]|nr:substrate-binding domain-containing protein [Xanthobacteraceae bacterium]